MALYRFLTGYGKEIRIISSSKTPDIYCFLDPSSVIESCEHGHIPKNPPKKNDLVFIIDLCNYERLGIIADFMTNNDATKCIIDHHMPEDNSADIYVGNTQAAATGSLIFDMILYIDENRVDSEIAKALYTAIVTDTSFFRYSNTTGRTHEIASELYNFGVKAKDVRRFIENRHEYCRQRLLGSVLEKTRLTEDGMIGYSFATLDMFAAAGAKREHTDGIIDHIRMIRGVEVAFFMIQEGIDDFKVSFRTGDSIMANEVAAELGGGGHAKASGANVSGPLAEVTAKTLTVIRNMLAKKGVAHG
jgi:phosphoesterase RecJ-like protein